jgi:hypothetical protein
MTQIIRTYIVTDERATTRVVPGGPLRRHLIMDQMFQGRETDLLDWIERMDDDGVRSRGFVRRTLCSRWGVDVPEAPKRTPRQVQHRYAERYAQLLTAKIDDLAARVAALELGRGPRSPP